MRVLIIIALLAFQCVSSETCPPPEDIIPCQCTTSGNAIRVQCSHLEHLKQLRSAVERLTDVTISTFIIKSSKFEYIPHNLFENVTIKEMEISESNFSRIGKLGDPQFKGLETSLETLKFRKSFTRENPLAFISLDNLTRLTTLEVLDSHVGFVHNQWFKRGPKSLRVVRFVKDKITAVGYSAFNSLIDLRVIDLSENELTYIPRWALPEPALLLEEINLERNKFETLPEDSFVDMPNLRTVNLELNELSTLDETTWMPVWGNLHLLNIDYNPVVCDKKIKWIYYSRKNLENKLIGTCYKPFNIMDENLYSLKPEELG